MSLSKDPDQRRKEQWDKKVEVRRGWNWTKFFGFGNLAGPLLTPSEEYTLHSSYLSKAISLNLSDITEMKIV